MPFKTGKLALLTIILIWTYTGPVNAQNPFIKNQFTADPTARVFEGKMYVYPSHDVDCGTDWFCMKDYHVFSSDDLVNWTDHGVILHQNEVAWVDTNANAMWAPDAIERGGTYFFYFPAIADTNAGFRGRKIGVATSDTPEGPFSPEAEPMEGVDGIDPNTFIDEDGQAYLYWSGRGIWGSKLNSNMMQIETEPKRLDDHHPQSGLREGPFMFERNGTYYLTYPRVIENTEALVYATGDHPLGPFDYQGIIMEEHPSGCWTNHHSIVEYKGQWYLFYHHNDYSPDFDKNRSIRVDSLFFNPDGGIQKVKPTFRGVGLTEATSKIQLDRYTAITDKGDRIEFLDTSAPFQGWKTVLSGTNAWVRYNSVKFEENIPNQIEIRVRAQTNSSLGIHLDSLHEPAIATVQVPQNLEWTLVEAPVTPIDAGIHDLFIKLKNNSQVEIDWVRFK